MSEADLLRKLAIAYEDDGWWEQMAEPEQQRALKDMSRIMPIIEAREQAAAVAMREACASKLEMHVVEAQAAGFFLGHHDYFTMAAQLIRALPTDAARKALDKAVLEARIEGLKLARTRTLPGHRTLINLGHVLGAVRAVEWVRMDIEREIADLERQLAELAAKEGKNG